MGPRTRIETTVTRLRRIDARELFWGGIIVLAFGWFLYADDPLLAAMAIPVEIIATVALVRPHIDESPVRDGVEGTEGSTPTSDDSDATGDR